MNRHTRRLSSSDTRYAAGRQAKAGNVRRATSRHHDPIGSAACAQQGMVGGAAALGAAAPGTKPHGAQARPPACFMPPAAACAEKCSAAYVTSGAKFALSKSTRVTRYVTAPRELEQPH